MESIEIGLNDLEPINLNFSDNASSSVNFGPGVELLMNNSKRNSSNNVNIDLGELDNLEKELNELSGNSSQSTTTKNLSNLSGFASNLFGFDTPAQTTNEPTYDKNDSNLGQATKESIGNTKTWDGFSKMNDIPATDMPSAKMTDREKRRKKKMMIKKLEEWYEKGLIKNISHFNNDSVYEEVEDEYESALEDKRKKDSTKLMGWWFMTFVNSVEYANAAFNPFDINLDGWGEQISEDIDSYDEIFSELHEKYKGGKLSPELSLLLRLGFSAAVVNFTNKALSTATPGFNDVIRQSPELMRMFTNATVSSMSQQSPGFAFASNLMNNPDQINNSFGPPPAPVETKNQAPPARPGNMQYTPAPNNSRTNVNPRQDINAARGSMFREQGVELNNNFVDINQQERSARTSTPQGSSFAQTQNGSSFAQTQNGSSFAQTQNGSSFAQTQQGSHFVPNSNPQPSTNSNPNSFFGQGSAMMNNTDNNMNNINRQEMRGPQNSDIDNILSGLKSKTVAMPTQQTPIIEDDSMISISSLKDLQNTNMPKRGGRRKNRSDKNTVSLDL